ncbi:MAG: dephospho-CoA kinase [Spirochaetes bacterium]|nr:dephospho-CoA kinase [Spirochaetota bacterium]
MILGLTGGYCAGKNEVARLLETRGFTQIDVDRLGHRALEVQAAKVAALLGPDVLDPDGKPVRKAIGALVFADSGLLAAYEAIVHPVMSALLDAEIDHALSSGWKVCVNAAILYGLPQAARCDAILELRSPLVARILRGRKRDSLSFMAILLRIRGQRTLFIPSRRPAGIRVLVIRNPGTRDGLAQVLDRALGLLGQAVA